MNPYQENILDHSKNPRNYGVISNADKILKGANFFCGDEINYYLKFDKEKKIKKTTWTGQACAICSASASMLSDQIMGRDLKQLNCLNNQDIKTNLGIELSPTRLKCALLPLETIKKLNQELN